MSSPPPYPAGAASVRRCRLAELPVSPKLEVRPARGEELPELAALLSERIPGLCAPFSSFSRVHAYSQSIFSVLSGPSVVGCFACLHLNAEGLERLLVGSLSMVEPDEACLAAFGARVHAIYAWAWAVRPPTNGIKAMGNFMAWLQRGEFSEAEIFGRPVTEKGFGFARNLDFRPVEAGIKKGQGLWVTARFA